MKLNNTTSDNNIRLLNIQHQKTQSLAFTGQNTPDVNHNYNEITLPTFQGYYLSKLKQKSCVSFGHKWADHMSYGVTFNYDKDGNIKGPANIKLFTYPDLKDVSIQIANPKADFVNDYRNEVDSKHIKSIPLNSTGNGVYTGSSNEIEPGDRYRFELTFPDGKKRYISDLYSYEQRGLIDWPVAYDQKAYDRSTEGKGLRKLTADWNEALIPGKINNIKALTNPNLINSQASRLMQVHLGTFTEEGCFESAIKKLDDIKEMGFNGIEIMPHGFFQSTNWGYDPSFVFASQYGGTDKFKLFCDKAHEKGLNVIIDVVNNHYSMDHPEIMTEAGPYNSPHNTHEFGPCPNYTDENTNNRDGVRDWRINEALYWLKNGADGIRFDLTDYTKSGQFNTQLNMEIQEHFPGTPTFAESPSIESCNPLPNTATTTNLPAGSEEKEKAHLEITKKAQNDEFGWNNQGFTHRWHFDWSHSIEHTILHPFDRKIEHLKNQVYDAQNQMKILFSHDEMGKQEADGNHVIVKIILSKLFGNDIGDMGWGTSYEKYERYWKASRAVRELTERYVTNEPWPDEEKQLAREVGKYEGNINDYNSKTYGIPDYEKGGLGLGDLGRIDGISKEAFGKIFKEAAELDKAAMGFLFSQPGPKMVFQSFDKPDRRFAFFRENSEHFYNTFKRWNGLAPGVDWETNRKGHRLDLVDIIKQAKLNNLEGKYSTAAKNHQENMKTLITKLNKINNENPALQDGQVMNVVGNHQNVISIHSKKGDNEIYSITHFNDSEDFANYRIFFPEGSWKEILNTSDSEFGGENTYVNYKEVIGGEERTIKLPKASTLIFKRIK